MPTVFYGPQQEYHFDQFSAVVKNNVLIWEVKQEPGSNAFQFNWNDFFSFFSKVLEPICFCLYLRTHREGGQSCWPSHDFGHHKQVLIENGLELPGPVCDGLAHVVGSFLLEYRQFRKLKWVRSKLFPFGTLVIYFSEGQSIGK